MTTFADLSVPRDLVDALDGQGIGEPFAIQVETIPPALAGRDVSGRAPTGSGKTLAFGVPLVAKVQRARPKRPRALVLVPTRELAAQVSRDLARLGADRDVRVHAFYGGTKFEPQAKALRRGVDIAVACPGRLADLVNQGIARLDGVDLVVVDEADRMADMGFLPEVRRLVDQTDAGRQTLLFSATLDGDVNALVRRYQHDPVTVDVTPEVSDSELEHHFWTVPHAKRVQVTAAIVDRVGQTIVFTRTRHGADRVARQLERAGAEAVAIHGDRTQAQRERALRAFRSGEARALVATDVAARGIHVDDVACVVHFDLPADPKDFIHRSGRTGRAGATGVVVALAMPDRRKDNDKLFRSLGLDVAVTEPDVDRLPLGPAASPRRPRRDGPPASSRPGRERAPDHRGAKHKPSGRPARRRVESPADTSAGRKKGPGRPGPEAKTTGTRSEQAWSRRPESTTAGSGSTGPKPKRPKPKRPKSNGPGSKRSGSKRPKQSGGPSKTKKKHPKAAGKSKPNNRSGRANRPKGPRAGGRPKRHGPSGNAR